MQSLMADCVEVPTVATQIQVMPNPAHQQVRIGFEGGAQRLQVVNAMGQPILQRELSVDSQGVLLPTADWRPGLYFVFVEKEGRRLSQKFVVMH